ncbi:hypothetical protein HBB16_01755 [Pseudonocardia sp. MCCB 268]|nr:hypothetical protein [Pseudonocardia cytotoxica]
MLEGTDAAVAATHPPRSAGGPGGLAPRRAGLLLGGRGRCGWPSSGAEQLTSTEAGHRVCHSAGAGGQRARRAAGGDGARELAGQRPGAVPARQLRR